MPNDVTDAWADAIIGLILIGRLAGKTVIPGIQNGKDVTPKPGAEVFKLDPEQEPVPVTRFLSNGKPAPFYHGSADNMERQAKKVIDRTEVIPGEFD